MLDAIANIVRDYRNFVTHVYFAVAARRLWRVIHEEIFPLEAPLRALLDHAP